MRFYIQHPSILDNPKTYLANDYDKNQSSLGVKNIQSFVTSKYIVVGNMGFDNAELTRPQTITPPDTLGITPSTKFPHNADTPITLIEWNKIKIYRSTAGIDGSYSVLATIDIDVDADVTYYDDNSGRPSYYYKFTYYNEFASVESDFSDAFAGSGFVFHSLKTLTDRVLSLFGDSKRKFVKDEEVKDALNEFYSLVQVDLAVSTRRFNIGTQDITLNNTDDEYQLNTDFLLEKGVRTSSDGGTTFPYPVPMFQLDSQGSVVQSHNKYAYLVINGKIKFDRKPDAGDIARVFYVRTTTTLNNQTDVLENPYMNHTGMFVKYALAVCYLKRGDKEWYETLTRESMNGKDLFIRYIKKLSHNHPQFGEIVNTDNM